MDDAELAQKQQAARDENVRVVQVTMTALEDFYSASAEHIRMWKRYDFARDLLEKLLAKAQTENMGNRWLREQLLKIWEYATIEAIEGLEK
jgi:hypothetical protein